MDLSCTSGVIVLLQRAARQNYGLLPTLRSSYVVLVVLVMVQGGG